MLLFIYEFIYSTFNIFHLKMYMNKNVNLARRFEWPMTRPKKKPKQALLMTC